MLSASSAISSLASLPSCCLVNTGAGAIDDWSAVINRRRLNHQESPLPLQNPPTDGFCFDPLNLSCLLTFEASTWSLTVGIDQHRFLPLKPKCSNPSSFQFFCARFFINSLMLHNISCHSINHSFGFTSQQTKEQCFTNPTTAGANLPKK